MGTTFTSYCWKPISFASISKLTFWKDSFEIIDIGFWAIFFPLWWISTVEFFPFNNVDFTVTSTGNLFLRNATSFVRIFSIEQSFTGVVSPIPIVYTGQRGSNLAVYSGLIPWLKFPSEAKITAPILRL